MIFLVEMGVHHIAQAGLEFLATSDPPALVFQSTGITGVNHFIWPLFKKSLFLNCILGFGVHVKIMQDSCIGTHVAVWFADWCVMVSHWGFDLHFSNDQWCWAVFHIFFGYVNVFFWDMSVHVLCPLFNEIVWFVFW